MAEWKLLVSITAGRTYRFSSENLQVTRAIEGDVLNFVGALIGTPQPPALGDDDASMDVTLPTSALDVQSLRAAGIQLGGAEAEVALWKSGEDWARRVILLRGAVMPASEQRYRNSVSFTLATFEQQLDRPFPPCALGNMSFPALPEASIGKTLLVLYGECRDVPLMPTSKPAAGDTTVRLLGPMSPLPVASIAVRPQGIEDDEIQSTVGYIADPESGATISYVDLDLNNEKVLGASVFVADLPGHVGTDGHVLTGLGDVIDHAIRTYAVLPPDRIDEARMSRFRSRANRINVASQFGGEPGPSVLGTLKSRYGVVFPVAIGWQNGRIGADYLGYDASAPVCGRFREGAQILEIADPVPLVGEDGPVFSEYTFHYDRNTVAKTFRETLRADRSTHQALADAHSRWGRVVYPPVQLVDVNDGQGAQAVADWHVESHSIARTQPTALMRTSDIIRWPLREKHEITSARLSWSAEPFRCERVAPRADDLDLCDVTFTSFNPSP